MGTALMTPEPERDLPPEVLTVYMGDDASPWLRGTLMRFLLLMRNDHATALSDAQQLNKAVQAWCRFVCDEAPQ